MYKFKILVSDYLSSVFLQSSYQPSEDRPAHISQHQCSNFLAKYPTTHREVGHLSNTDIKVKFFLRARSPEHLFNNELFENLLNKREKKTLESKQHIMMNLENLDTAKGVAQ